MAQIDKKYVPFFIVLPTPVTLTSLGNHPFEVTGLAAALAPFARSLAGKENAITATIHSIGFSFSSVSEVAGVITPTTLTWAFASDELAAMIPLRQTDIVQNGTASGTAFANVETDAFVWWTTEISIYARIDAGSADVENVYGILEIS